MTNDQANKYFLGQLSEIEAADFEEESALSAGLTEHAQTIESELVDGYVRNRLSQTERTLFEDNYLTTEARRQKVRLAQIFLKNIQDEPQNEIQIKPQISFWQTFFGQYQIKIAFATAILICALAVIFIVFRSTGNDETEIAGEQDSNQSPIPENVNQPNVSVSNSNVNTQNSEANLNLNRTNTSNNSTDTKPKIQPTPTPKTIEPIQPTFASFMLLPGTLRSGGEQFIKILPNTDKINLRLTLPKDAVKYSDYSITVKTSNNETILTAKNLKSPNLTIPAAKLENDTYIIFLEGNNPQKPSESVAEYTFRVNR